MVIQDALGMRAISTGALATVATVLVAVVEADKGKEVTREIGKAEARARGAEVIVGTAGTETWVTS